MAGAGPGRRRIRALAAAAALVLAACGGRESPPPAARPYDDPGFVQAGDLRLHYALTATADLHAEIAGSYGIEQSHNLALLAITLVAPDGTRRDAAALTASAVSLTGRRLPVALLRHADARGPTWLGTVAVRDREPVTIELRARAAPAGPEIAARFTRIFYVAPGTPPARMP